MEIISAFFPQLWWLIPLITIVALVKLYKPKVKGKTGEMTVSMLLKTLDKNKYLVLDDLMVKVKDRTSQIDHVIVSNYGIFVIETKNYSGRINGKESDYKWKLKGRTDISNPTRQNYGHVQALKEVLSEFKGINYIPIVAFTTNGDLKVSTKTDVVYTTKLVATIKKYNEKTITDSAKENIYKRLKTLNINNEENRKTHVKEIRKNEAEKSNKISNNICPSCGSKLVVRDGKYGKFKGCSGFPKCRFKTGL